MLDLAKKMLDELRKIKSKKINCFESILYYTTLQYKGLIYHFSTIKKQIHLESSVSLKKANK